MVLLYQLVLSFPSFPEHLHDPHPLPAFQVEQFLPNPLTTIGAPFNGRRSAIAKIQEGAKPSSELREPRRLPGVCDAEESALDTDAARVAVDGGGPGGGGGDNRGEAAVPEVAAHNEKIRAGTIS